MEKRLQDVEREIPGTCRDVLPLRRCERGERGGNGLREEIGEVVSALLEVSVKPYRGFFLSRVERALVEQLRHAVRVRVGEHLAQTVVLVCLADGLGGVGERSPRA